MHSEGMLVTQALLGEHGVFYALFDRLEATLGQARETAQVREAAALLEAALLPHAQLEEELLLAPMTERLGGAGPMAVLRQEHDEIERGLRRARTATSVEDARRAFGQTLGLLRDHFAKEEQVLFPLAESALQPGELRAAGQAWAKRRRVLLA